MQKNTKKIKIITKKYNKYKIGGEKFVYERHNNREMDHPSR